MNTQPRPDDFTSAQGLPDAFLFDCDGTITDEGYLPFIVGFALSRLLGERYNPQRFHDVFNANVGGGFDKYFAKYKEASQAQGEDIASFPKESTFLALAIASYVNILRALQAKQQNSLFKIRPGMIEGMQRAAATGRPLAIVTNASPAIVEANMAAAGIYVKGKVPPGVTPKVLVDAVINKSHFPDQKTDRKPAPFPYEEACRVLSALTGRDIQPERCIGFEDSRNGHESMLRARIGTRVHMGTDAIAQPFAFKVGDQDHKADCVVSAEGMSAATMEDIISHHAAKMLQTAFPTYQSARSGHLLAQPGIEL
jgi:beta-phosphoglucomutase-like phosphatase (HAD superfamily)